MSYKIDKLNLYVDFLHEGLKAYENQNHKSADIDKFFDGKVGVRRYKEITELSVHVECVQFPHIYARKLKACDGVLVDICIDGRIKGVLSREQFNPFWSRPSFEKDLSKIPYNTQNMLISLENGGYISVLPICTDEFKSVIVPSTEENTLRFSMGKMYDGASDLSGIFAVFGFDDNPFEAVKSTYKYACEHNLIKTRLREGKSLDKIYQGLGWCTWNTCYRDVSEKLILEKLEEFKNKDISVKWIMIDDGWMQTSGEHMTLKSFKEDREKFPNGLKGCIEKIKNDYGVEKVGVWHTITGYWFGVEKDSELYIEQKENLIETNSGLFVPNGAKAYNFFAGWFAYLKKQGVDFVKIDGQGNSLEFMYGRKNCIKDCCKLQTAVDTAVRDYFDSNAINCMAMNNININNRPFTSLSRNSDDFMPDKPETFVSHIMQNAYNAVFHSSLFFCDFDMWKTDDVTAKQSSVLRAISGGPVYISDSIGKTNAEYIYPLIDNDGNIIRCDDSALPMPEHLFDGPTDGILKLFNRIGKNFVLAVFNLSGTEKSVNIKTDTFGEKCSARGYFSEKFYTGKEIILNLQPNDVEIFTFYNTNGEITPIVDFTKYIDIDQ